MASQVRSARTVRPSKVTYSFADHAQLQLDSVTSTWTERDLVRWLDRECRQTDIAQPSLVKWLLKLVEHLRVDRRMSLTALVRARHQLKDATLREIERRRLMAVHRVFQTAIPQFLASPMLDDSFRYGFTFRAGDYPANPNKRYRGSFKFKKHYHGIIHDLREKTDSGQTAEEFRCAVAIDSHPAVKHWIRNVEREKLASFWLPTSTDIFYPDFVCELHDGRLLVVEYKGEPYVTNDDSREKAQIGEQWARSSGGRCLFLMATKKDELGREVEQQIADVIGTGRR